MFGGFFPCLESYEDFKDLIYPKYYTVPEDSEDAEDSEVSSDQSYLALMEERRIYE